MNLSPEVAALLRQALHESRQTPNTATAYRILAGTVANLLTPEPEAEAPTIEPDGWCEMCGQVLPSGVLCGDLCTQCNEEYDEQVAEYEADHRLETALACKCGAWGINPVTSNVYHCADCVCGAE